MFKIKIASLPDRPRVVAEIYWNDHYVAELRDDETGEKFIDIYPPKEGQYWHFELADLNRVLEEASARLWSTEIPRA